MGRLFPLGDLLDSDAWYTPAWVFDGLGIRFDLDVAAPTEPTPWLPARDWYTASDDGLSQPWSRVVWCNPPYSNPAPWCHRWAQHPDGLLLIRSDLSTSGPHRAFDAAAAMWVPPKRLQFVSGAGVPTGSVNFSTVLLARGEVCATAVERLASSYGGAARRLV